MSEKKHMPQGFKATNYAADTCKSGFDSKNLGKLSHNNVYNNRHNDSNNNSNSTMTNKRNY